MGFWDEKRILLTGGKGFLGTYVNRELVARGVAPENIVIPRSKDMDLRKWENCVKAVDGIDLIIHLAARVGGIGLNQKMPGTLFYDNAIMGIQLMEAARQQGVEKTVIVGTICAYPKFAPVPFKETDLWNGYPEETNAAYGLAKKMLLVQSQAYRTQYEFKSIYLLPVNLYGPGDNFDPESSHVIPALIRKFIDAKERGQAEMTVWGTGMATREFMYVEDAALGICLATEKYDEADPVNLGVGQDIQIRILAEMIGAIVGYEGKIVWDSSRPDGQPRRKLDVTRAERLFDFRASVSLETGLKRTVAWYMAQRKVA